MKTHKIQAIIITFTLLVCSMMGCGKNEYVTRTEESISAIGTVTLDSEAVIEQAENNYNLLSDKDKKEVENYQALQFAREEYNRLLEKAKEEEKEKELKNEVKEPEIVHQKTIAQWAKEYTIVEDFVSIQTSLYENDKGEVEGDIKFRFSTDGFSNITMDSPEAREIFLDAMDDYMFAIKTDLQADNYTISKITGTSSQYNKTITIP